MYHPINSIWMLCLHGIQAMNCSTKMNLNKALTNYSLTGKQIFYVMSGLNGVNPFHTQLRGISSYMTVNGKWGVEIYHILIGPGVMKVSYHQQFQRAVSPTWVLDAFEQILNRSTDIGFEENKLMPDRNGLISNVTNYRNDEVKLNIDSVIKDVVDKSLNEVSNNYRRTKLQWSCCKLLIQSRRCLANINNDNEEILQPELIETMTY